MNVLRNALLATGEQVDVEISGGIVTKVSRATPGPGTDLAGFLLAPAFADPHVHLDKALTIDLVENPNGTVAGAMASYERVLREDTVERVATRARVVAREMIESGVGWARVHVGCGRLLGNIAIDALVGLRDELAELIDLQIVAHIGGPEPGQSWAEHSIRLESALDAGADLVGGNPWSEKDPDAALTECFDVALRRGIGVDFHLDETTNSSSLQLRALASLAQGAHIPVTASHCVSLGVQESQVISEIASEVAAAGIAIVTLPATNLYLQGREQTPQLRGLPPIDALRNAGVLFAAGSDNIRDPFNPVGTVDPLRTGALCVLAGQQTPAQAWSMIGADARQVLGVQIREVEAGIPANLVAVKARSVTDAMAHAPSERKVWRAGRLIYEAGLQRTSVWS